MERSKRHPVVQVRHGTVQTVDDDVILEKDIALYVNGAHQRTFFATPEDLEALAIGYLKNEGLICGLEDVQTVSVQDDRIDVQCRLCSEPCASGRFPETTTVVTSATLFAQQAAMQARMTLFERTGAAHSGAVYDGERCLAFAEDVARHNVLDKLCGQLLLARNRPTAPVLVFSGRLAGAIVQKAAAMGMVVLAGISAPTSAGIAYAETAGMTLAGFVRAPRLNLYTFPERVQPVPMPQKTPIVTITAVQSGSGKTTLIEGLVRAWNAQGIRVAVVKYSSHAFDTVGKDTARYRAAGAHSVFFEGPHERIIMTGAGRDDVLIQAMQSGVDLVVVESRTVHRGLVYEVVRQAVATQAAVPNRAGVITDRPELFTESVVLPLNDPMRCAQQILEYIKNVDVSHQK